MRILLALLAPLMLSAAEPRLMEGNPSAKVRVLIYEDLQCPDCAAFRRILDEKLLPQYGGKVAFEHYDFPLAKHPWAMKAAVTARYFQETSPELALKFRKYMLEGIAQTKVENLAERIAAFAKANNADPDETLAALEDSRFQSGVEADIKDGVARGVSKTPTVIVAGKPFIETIKYEEVAAALDAALK